MAMAMAGLSSSHEPMYANRIILSLLFCALYQESYQPLSVVSCVPTISKLVFVSGNKCGWRPDNEGEEAEEEEEEE
jgi:hypothetical protein